VTKAFGGARSRWFAAAVSVAVSAAMFGAQDRESECCAPVHASAPGAQPALSVGVPFVASAREAELLAASAPAPPVEAADFEVELSPGVTPETGLQVHTIWAARAISMMFFREVTTIGGVRQDPLRWHPDGLAIDVMIPNHDTPEGIELGNQIAGYALANAKRWGVLHVIWRQGFYPGIGAPSWMANYGNETANHFDHVHIATDGGGYPTGGEKYFLGSMSRE
jgi:hypothetical protein